MKTRLTELLGIKYPIILGPMAWVCLPGLVAAVSNAGGLGILGAAPMLPEQLRDAIRETRRLTTKPFGVNFIPDNPHLDELVDIIIAEKVPVVSYGIGNPKHIIDRTKASGIINLPTTGSLEHSLKAERDGADAVIVQGHEAGGHNSPIATMILVPLVASKMQVPVVAAGGIVDGRGLIAAFALGAEGIEMGTRFMLTKESPIPQNVKDFMLKQTEHDTRVTGHLTGVRCRVLNNKLVREFQKLDQEKASVERYVQLGIGTFRKSMVDGDVESGSIAAGQCLGLIKDIPSCQELVERIIDGAESVMERVTTKIR